MSTPIPHRRSTTLLALLPSAVLLGGATLLALSWFDRLPDRIASHYSGNQPDGWSSPGALLLLFGVVFGAVAVIGWLIALLRGQSAATRRMGVATAVGMSAFGAALIIGTTWVSRVPVGSTVTQSSATGDQLDLIIMIGVLAGVLLGIVAAVAVPADAAVTARGAVQGPRMALGADERAMWSRRSVSPPALIVGGVAVLGTAVTAVWTQMWGIAVVPVLLLVLVLVSSVFQVTVDRQGLVVRSAAGWPSKHIALTEIEAVRVVQVHPIREYGGMGYRVGRDGAVGWVLRGGEAIRVEQPGGRAFVVTVDDAETGAALLTTLAERAQSSTGRSV